MYVCVFVAGRCQPNRARTRFFGRQGSVFVSLVRFRVSQFLPSRTHPIAQEDGTSVGSSTSTPALVLQPQHQRTNEKQPRTHARAETQRVTVVLTVRHNHTRYCSTEKHHSLLSHLDLHVTEHKHKEPEDTCSPRPRLRAYVIPVPKKAKTPIKTRQRFLCLLPRKKKQRACPP